MGYGPEWKDVSSFTKGDTERTPNSFECILSPEVSCKMHRHIDYPDTWLLRSRYLDIELWVLAAKEVDAAKVEATGVILQHLKKRRTDLDFAIKALS